MATEIICSPPDLMEAAKCFQCIPPKQINAIKIYLLAQIAGMGNVTPAELMAEAKCYDCIPPVKQKAIETYLLCLLASTPVS